MSAASSPLNKIDQVQTEGRNMKKKNSQQTNRFSILFFFLLRSQMTYIGNLFERKFDNLNTSDNLHSIVLILGKLVESETGRRRGSDVSIVRLPRPKAYPLHHLLY